MFKAFYYRNNHEKAWLALGLFVVCMALIVPDSFAQSSRDLTNRINRLENEIETLSRAVYKGERPPASAGVSFSNDPSAQANAEVRLQQMEVEIRSLRGKIEEQNFELGQMKKQLERALSDMELRLGDLEGGGGGGAKPKQSTSSLYTTKTITPQASAAQTRDQEFTWSSNPQDTTPAAGESLGAISKPRPTASYTTPASVPDQAASSYENAFALLKNSQYEQAARGFESFINSHPNHVLAGNAKYWLGETHYVRGNYERAARIFAEGYQQYPKGTKAADNLLKLGMSLAGLGNKDDACVALQQLEKDFPTGSVPVLRRAEQEMSRLGCA